MMSVLSVLKDSLLVLKHIPGRMLCLARSGDEETELTFCWAMVDIILEYFVCFPSSFTNMPLDTLVMVVSNMKNKQTIQGKVSGICCLTERALEIVYVLHKSLTDLNLVPFFAACYK